LVLSALERAALQLQGAANGARVIKCNSVQFHNFAAAIPKSYNVGFINGEPEVMRKVVAKAVALRPASR
jgi:hypothetical protein